jgi:predicted SAM-dependent methyltransferase
MKTFLHVGCGHSRQAQTTKGFNVPWWKEVRYDIDANVKPDIVGSISNMISVASASMDAIFCNHNLEHVYTHEVPVVLSEFRRVLKEDGFAVVNTPDLLSVCQLVAQDKLEGVAYDSLAGPISPLDMLYGHTNSIKTNLFMSHRTGFTKTTLGQHLKRAGFAQVAIKVNGFNLFSLSTVSNLPQEEIKELATYHFS